MSIQERMFSEPYVVPPNLVALRTVVGLCRKRLSDCNHSKSTSSNVVGLTRQQSELQELLERTLLESENNSVLLIGSRGSGKSLLTEHVLKVGREKYKRVEDEEGESRTTKRKRSSKDNKTKKKKTTGTPSSSSFSSYASPTT